MVKRRMRPQFRKPLGKGLPRKKGTVDELEYDHRWRGTERAEFTTNRRNSDGDDDDDDVDDDDDDDENDEIMHGL